MSKFRLRISESALSKFTTCDEQFRMSRLYRRPMVKPGSPQGEGSEAHAILSGAQADKPSSHKVASFVGSLRKLEKSMGLEIIGREVTQEFEIMADVDAIRIIDAYGYDKDGRSVIIDYKTTSSGRAWEPISGNVPPVALGWQSAMYLYPPPESVKTPFASANWPSVMYFLVASPYEPLGVFGVERSIRREGEMIEKIKQVREALRKRGLDKPWPRTFGYHCGQCDFLEACYGIEGWENGFIKRDDNG